MNKKEYNQFSEDLALLEKLKAEQEINLKKCMSRINRRRHLILFSTSIAAVMIALSFLILSTRTEERKERVAEQNRINIPTLILESGEIISLNSNESEVKYLKKKSIEADKKSDQRVEKLNAIIIPNCYTHKVILEDGTEVFLNANSEMKYPNAFNNETREIYFKGEGYFKVAKSNKQFIVHTADFSIKVYGTEFNVNTNRNKNTETVLVEGSVGIALERKGKEVRMKANQLFSYNSDNGTEMLGEINPNDYLGWMSGNFICNSRPLSQLLEDVSAWYGVQFIETNAFNKKIVNVNISRDIPLEQILETIEEMSNITFTKERRNEYRIKER